MKKTVLYILITTVIICSCDKQDSVYKKYVVAGGYDYPAKAINLSCESGYKNVTVKWSKPMDPAVKTAKLFWDNYADSTLVDYSNYPDGHISINVNNLDDRSYTFDVVNYDQAGNKSLSAEIIVSPYGEGWMSSRSERTVISAKMKEDSAIVIMSKSTDEMVATRFRYINSEGQWVYCDKQLKKGENRISFYRPMKGKRFEYSSSFCPKSGKDTVWRKPIKSIDGISFRLNCLRWAVSATNGQVFADNIPDKIFDGKKLSGCRYHSSKLEINKAEFPKILSIDTQQTIGNEFAFTSFEFCTNPDSESLRYIKNFIVYIGNTPYDPDEKNFRQTFGIPFISNILSPKSSVQSFNVSKGGVGKYLSIVFTDSWNKEGYIDLWELIPYGYIPSLAD